MFHMAKQIYLGLGPLSGTYILVPTSPDAQLPPECTRLLVI